MSPTALEKRRFAASSWDDEPLFEEIDGQRVELPSMGAFACILASRLMGHLQIFLKANPLGEAVMETLFRLPIAKQRNRRPDLAFVSYVRWPRSRAVSPDDNAWDVVPDLAVEVISPNDYAEEVQEKISEYFEAGVKQVWVLYPKNQSCVTYRSLGDISYLGAGDVLEGGDVLPGFRLELRELLPE